MANSTYLQDVNTEKVEALMESTDESVKYFESVSTKTAEKYTEHLDKLMQNLYKRIVVADSVEDKELEKDLLELTNLIYFMGDKLETLGIYGDMSSSAAKEVYNKAYLEAQYAETDSKKKPTVAELTAVAEQESQYESVVNDIYTRAYKMVKFKVEQANKMVDVLRKVITRRMQEQSLASRVPVEE